MKQLPYITYTKNDYKVECFADSTEGKFHVEINGKISNGLPDYYVTNFHIHNNNLYVIYTREILCVPSINSGNTQPEELPTITMLDYYSYEPPIMLTDCNNILWVHIGGRLFKRENQGWKEVARFSIGESAEVKGKNLIFSKNMLKDNNTEGYHVFDTETETLLQSN